METLIENDKQSKKNSSKNFVYLIATIAAAGLIVYGAIFYTRAPDAEQKAQVSSSSSQPQSSQSIAESGDQILGNPDAPVTMIEYGSYLCGHCVIFGRTTFKQIKENYIDTGKVKFIYRSYPPIELGVALVCAAEQDKYWEYHHAMIEKDIKAAEDLTSTAQEVGLDVKGFEACLVSGDYDEQAQKWFQQGQDAGVEGTPSFFINGTKIVGNQPYSEFEKAINDELAKK